MQVTWNGTGSAWSYSFGNSSAIVEAGGQRILIDCGHTVPARLQQMGLSFRDFDAVIITHLHGDHIYGLEEWGFRSFLIWKERPRLFIADTLSLPLWRHVLSGTMGQQCNHQRLLRDYYDVSSLHTDTPENFGPWTIELHPVRHIPDAPAYGIKLKAEGMTVAFTGDSRADADPFFYDGVDLTFHDCSFLPFYPDTVHAHFEELQRYPQEWRKRTYLVHYDEMVKELREDALWCETLKATGMRLAEPFVPIKAGKTA